MRVEINTTERRTKMIAKCKDCKVEMIQTDLKIGLAGNVLEFECPNCGRTGAVEVDRETGQPLLTTLGRGIVEVELTVD